MGTRPAFATPGAAREPSISADQSARIVPRLTANTWPSHSPRLISQALLFMESGINWKSKVTGGVFEFSAALTVSCTLRVGGKTFDLTVQADDQKAKT